LEYFWGKNGPWVHFFAQKSDGISKIFWEKSEKNWENFDFKSKKGKSGQKRFYFRFGYL